MSPEMTKQVKEFVKRIRPLFYHLKLKWNINGKMRVPTQKDLYNKFTELYYEIKDSEKYRLCESEGLKVEKFISDYETFFVISFTINKQIKL